MKMATQSTIVERLIKSRGGGVWVGWHVKHGWLFLDQRYGCNPQDESLVHFVRANDWELLGESRDAWRAPSDVVYHSRLAAVEPAKARQALSELERLCDMFDERSLAFRQRANHQVRELQRGAARERPRTSAATDPCPRPSGNVERDLHLIERLAARHRADEERMRSILAVRGVRSVVHFTPVSNLRSILCDGLKPRADLDPSSYQAVDGIRADGFPEASCVSISFPNWRMLYSYRCRDHQANWAIISIDPDVLARKRCLYFHTNAASRRSTELVNTAPERLMGARGLEAMFEGEVPGKREERGLAACYPFDPQAEVLIFDVIAPSFFRAVQLLHADKDVADMIREVAPGLRVGAGGSHFAPRADYEFWRQPDEAAVGSVDNEIPW